MTVQHHPSEATLVSYAAGTLWESAALVVEAHLDYCPTCSTTVRLAEIVGGTLLEDLPPAPLAPDAFEGALARLHEVNDTDLGTSNPLVAKRAPIAFPPKYSAALLEVGKPRLRWLALGVRHAVMQRRSSGETLRLLQVTSGTALPRHTHEGMELTLVLEGAFVDETGRYAAGDVAEVDTKVSHRPVAEGVADCVCLVATQRRLRFGGLLGRLLGTLARI